MILIRSKGNELSQKGNWFSAFSSLNYQKKNFFHLSHGALTSNKSALNNQAMKIIHVKTI